MGGNSAIQEPTKTLYDRLGGDSFIQMATCAFFDEIVETPTLKPFFQNISTSALKCHQVKLFRVIFGKEDEKPKDEDLLDFMLRTHTRLFRDLGLNARHFDLVAECFVQGLQTFQVDQSLIDECVAILVPLRVVFEYGAEVAAKEKAMSQEERQALPLASPAHFGTDTPVVLPEYSKIDVPDWLPVALGKRSNTSSVRAWTCDMTDRFGAEGDLVIADTFMDQPYMDHHVYLVAFLQLAFWPDDAFWSEDNANEERNKVLEMVRFPRGPKNACLSQELFDRMIAQFKLTCHKQGVSTHAIRTAERQLLAHRHTFAEATTPVGGVGAPHILRKKRKQTKKGRWSSMTIWTLLDFDTSGDDAVSVVSALSALSKNSSSNSLGGSLSSDSARSEGKKKKKKGLSKTWSKLKKNVLRAGDVETSWFRTSLAV